MSSVSNFYRLNNLHCSHFLRFNFPGEKSVNSKRYNRTPFAKNREAIVQFDWLVARQSKSDIKMSPHSYCIIRHPEHDNIKIHMVESEKSFKFSGQQTLKDRDPSPNGNHINLKPEKQAAIRF